MSMLLMANLLDLARHSFAIHRRRRRGGADYDGSHFIDVHAHFLPDFYVKEMSRAGITGRRRLAATGMERTGRRSTSWTDTGSGADLPQGDDPSRAGTRRTRWRSSGPWEGSRPTDREGGEPALAVTAGRVAVVVAVALSRARGVGSPAVPARG